MSSKVQWIFTQKEFLPFTYFNNWFPVNPDFKISPEVYFTTYQNNLGGPRPISRMPEVIK
jgi:hypothetical protein